MKELSGKTIQGIRVSNDQHYISFDLADGEEVSYYAEGDCCSESWFADILGVKQALGRPILEVKEIQMPEEAPDGRTRQEYDRIYGTEITTDRGKMQVIFRNSSNGYYGGSLWHFENPTPDVIWEQITEDWAA